MGKGKEKSNNINEIRENSSGRRGSKQTLLEALANALKAGSTSVHTINSQNRNVITVPEIKSEVSVCC